MFWICDEKSVLVVAEQCLHSVKASVSHIAFALLIKLSLSQTKSVLTFTFLILFPIPVGKSEQGTMLSLAFYWG